VIALEDGALRFGDRCRIGPRCVVSSKNSIRLDCDVHLESDVLVMDHAHAYEDISRPILFQGETAGGEIVVSEGCSIGRGAVILCGDRRKLVLGSGCIIAPGAVVTRSFPANSMVSGNPATASAINATGASSLFDKDAANPQHAR
jgi:acetyltransferase-like isoleucine patch superfamily enzyme